MNEVQQQQQQQRFADVLEGLHGNRATSLTLDALDDPLFCQVAQSQFGRLTEALFANQSIFAVKIGARFLAGVANHEDQIVNFLRALWRIKTLGVVEVGLDGERPEIPLGTLAKSLAEVYQDENKIAVTQFRRLSLRAFIVRSVKEVVDVAHGLRALGRVLEVSHVLFRFSIQMGTSGTKDDESGILDPIVDLMTEMKHTHSYTLNAEGHSEKTCLVSEEGCRRLVGTFWNDENGTVFQKGFPAILDLTALGLNDAVLRSMTDALRLPHRLGEVYLFDNPALTYRTVEGWLVAIDHCDTLHSVQFGIEDWDATIKLHVKLNGVGRREAVENGLYNNRRVWVNWLAKLATMERIVQKFHFERFSRDNEALLLSALFLTVRSIPP